MEIERKYEEIDLNGDKHVFNSHSARTQFILDNPQLFFNSSEKKDKRYNVPKEQPKASALDVAETLRSTEIYRRAFGLMKKAQRKQIAYGIDKYPEPLNADTWSIIETIDHIIDESIDQLHYLVMLRIKLEQTNIKEEV